MELIGILMACAILIVVVAAFYYFFDSSTIDEEETRADENETQEERAQVIAKHKEQIEAERQKELSQMYSGQDSE